MKINTEIKIKVYWDEEEQVNKTAFEIDANQTTSIILTALEMTKNAAIEALKTHIKKNFENGQCTEEEFEKLMKTKFNKLTP